MREWELGEKAWHSEEWRDRKRELRRQLRKFKEGKIGNEEYIRRRN